VEWRHLLHRRERLHAGADPRSRVKRGLEGSPKLGRALQDGRAQPLDAGHFGLSGGPLPFWRRGRFFSFVTLRGTILRRALRRGSCSSLRTTRQSDEVSCLGVQFGALPVVFSVVLLGLLTFGHLRRLLPRERGKMVGDLLPLLRSNQESTSENPPRWVTRLKKLRKGQINT
jgi:hypothetical protein